VVSEYLAGAFLTLLKWWLAADMPYPPNRWRTSFSNWLYPECGQCSKKSEQKSASMSELLCWAELERQPHPRGVFKGFLV